MLKACAKSCAFRVRVVAYVLSCVRVAVCACRERDVRVRSDGLPRCQSPHPSTHTTTTTIHPQRSNPKQALTHGTVAINRKLNLLWVEATDLEPECKVENKTLAFYRGFPGSSRGLNRHHIDLLWVDATDPGGLGAGL